MTLRKVCNVCSVQVYAYHEGMARHAVCHQWLVGNVRSLLMALSPLSVENTIQFLNALKHKA